MTTFAPGTNPDYANAYNNWFYGGGQKSGANQPRPSEFGRGTRSATGQQPNPAPAQPASGSAPVNMSAYGGGGYGQYAQPTRSAAQQAMPQFQQYGRQNDLSQPQGFNLWGAQGAAQGGMQALRSTADSPSLHMWGAQGAAQGGMQGQSYTMPGYSQSFNGLTGQPTIAPQQSWDGNLAHQAPANRPAPVSWNTQGMDGQTYNGQQGFQQASQQRDAFMGGQGGLFDRLGQYAANPQLGPPQFDFNAMLNSANDAITNTGFQNPFTSPLAQNPTPSLNQQFYDPRPTSSYPMQGGGNGVNVQGFAAPAGWMPQLQDHSKGGMTGRRPGEYASVQDRPSTVSGDDGNRVYDDGYGRTVSESEVGRKQFGRMLEGINTALVSSGRQPLGGGVQGRPDQGPQQSGRQPAGDYRVSGRDPNGDTQYAGGTPYFDERTGQRHTVWRGADGAPLAAERVGNEHPGAVFDPNFRPTANAAPLPTSNPSDQAMYRPRVSGSPGRRSAIVGGDMAISEEILGTQKFDSIVSEYESRYGSRPPSSPTYPQAADYGVDFRAKDEPPQPKVLPAAKPNERSQSERDLFRIFAGYSNGDPTFGSRMDFERGMQVPIDPEAYNPENGLRWTPQDAGKREAYLSGMEQRSKNMGLSWRRKPSGAPPTPGAAQPVQTQDVGDAYNPSQARDSLPPVPQTPRRNAAPPASGDLAEQAAQAQQAELRRMQSAPTTARQDTTSTAGGRNVPKGTDQAVRAQLTKIDTELNKWERATYGTWQGSGPPQAWSDHINNLKRLRQRALAGDPAALAWSPKMQAPPPRR